MGQRARARAVILLLAVVALVIFLAATALNALRGEPTLNDLPTLSAEEWQSLTATGTQREAGTLLLNGKTAPRDRDSGCYYVPQSLSNTEWDALLTAPRGWTLYSTPDAAAAMGNRAELLRAGTVVMLVAVRGTDWYPLNVIFTGLPLMEWTTTDSTLRDPDAEEGESEILNIGQLRYFSGETLAVQESDMTWRVRGGASRAFEKLGYKLNLRTPEGENNHLAFGGLRSDDDWILRSLYTDPQKVRESTAITLWNEIAATAPQDDPSTAAMEYVELMIDGEYMGLFGLSERLDDKTVEAGGSDILYKYVTYGCPSTLRFQQAEQRGETELLNRGVRIYGTGGRNKTLWTPLQTLIATLYTYGYADQGFSGSLSQADHEAEAMNMPYEASKSYEELTAILDVQNAIDWGFFNQALQLADSDLNNTYMLAREGADGYRIHYIPWDMDYSFGTFNGGNGHSNVVPEYYRKLRSIYALDALLQADPAGISALGQARWTQLRATVLDTGHVWECIDAANAAVVDSGAFARDTARWPQGQNDESLDYIKQYIRDRLEFLDGYFLTDAWTDFD